MSKKKIVLITGASGRIGKYLVRKLLEKRYNVRVLIHETKIDSFGFNDFDNFEMVKGDLLNPSSLEIATKNVEIVCHLGAVFDNYPPYKYEIDNDLVYKFNVTGTYNILEAIRKSGTVKYIVFASSESVYSSEVIEHREPISEENNLHPNGRFYALSKILGEDLVRYYKDLSGIDYTILRFSGIVAGLDIIKFFEFSTWEASGVIKR